MKKTNQDNYIMEKDLGGVKGTWLFSVMDGHGANGHLVSAFIKKHLVQVLEQRVLTNFGIKSGSVSPIRLEKSRIKHNKSFLPPL